MNTLRLRFDKYLDERHEPIQGLVVNVSEAPERERLTQETPEQVSRMRNRVASVGRESLDHLDVNVQPGRYLVQVLFPGGRVMNREVKVEAEPQLQEITLELGQSPHEYLGWQHLVGNVESKSEYERKRPAITRSMLGTASPPLELKHVTIINSPGSAPISRGIFFERNRGSQGEPRQNFLDRLSRNPCVQIETALPVAQDETFVKFLFRPQGGMAHFRASVFDRHYLVVAVPQECVQYCVLPVPWMHSHGCMELDVEAVVQRLATGRVPDPRRPAYALSIAVRDSDTAMMIGYFGAGDFTAAAEALAPAKDALMMKMINPIAAAAGGYILLASRWDKEPADWHPWLRNLMHWFPWLPDGAIQHGWLRLNTGEDEASFQEARSCFLEALRRGLPFYSRGVSLLRDGLSVIAGESSERLQRDEEVDAALTMVRRMCARTNMKNPFTTIEL